MIQYGPPATRKRPVMLGAKPMPVSKPVQYGGTMTPTKPVLGTAEPMAEPVAQAPSWRGPPPDPTQEQLRQELGRLGGGQQPAAPATGIQQPTLPVSGGLAAPAYPGTVRQLPQQPGGLTSNRRPYAIPRRPGEA